MYTYSYERLLLIKKKKRKKKLLHSLKSDKYRYKIIYSLRITWFLE